MTELADEPLPDPASLTDEEDLRLAVLRLLGDSYDRAVEHRTGLSKTTVNDLRNQRRRLTLKTLALIVDAYDPARREEWLGAWRRVRQHPASTAGPANGSPQPSDGDAPEDDGDLIADLRAEGSGVATAGDPRQEEPPGRKGRRWGRRRIVVGSLVAAACVAATAGVVAIIDGSGTDAATTTPTVSPSTGFRYGPVPPPLGGPGAPPDGPGGPGAPGPVGGPGPPPNDATSTGATAVIHGCYTLPLKTQAQVVPEPGARTTGVGLAAAAYTYYPAWNPSLALGGRLSRRPPAGRLLVGADWADPATRDSSAAHNAGNGRFYPGGSLPLTDQNCFTIPPYNLGYGGYSGLTTRVYLLLVDAGRLADLGRQAAGVAGFTDTDLAERHIDVLGYFTVPATGT